jgi:outer membrane protein assembly factor BamB
VAAAALAVGAAESGVEAGGVPPPVKGKVRLRRTGMGIAGVMVSDGLNCVRTAKDGTFELPGRERARFVFVTVPSGYSTSTFHQLVKCRQGNKNFDLEPCQATGGKGCTFLHIADSEISEANPRIQKWAESVRRIADETHSAFIVHTGDICGRGGMVGHMMTMNDLTMGRPVRYCVGNHDLVHGSRGEEVFEAVFGPCWYSFEAGGVHFCVTPMNYGDHPPGYDMDEVADWLRNDLALVPANMPVVLFGHMLCNAESEEKAGFVFGKKRAVDLRELCNYRGFVYGHLHDTMFRVRGGAAFVCSSPPVGGGIDLSPASVRVVSVDEGGRITASSRHGSNPSPWRAVESGAVWETKLGGGVLHSTPLVVDGRVYVGTLDDGGRSSAAVYALDASTGKIVWRVQMENSIRNRLLLAGGRILAADAEGRLVALDPETGRVEWRHALPYHYMVMNASPAVSPDGRVVVYGIVRRMAALDAVTGKELWCMCKAAYEGVPQRFAVDSERFYGISCWDGIYAFDLKDGKQVWKIKDRSGCVYPGSDLTLVDGSLYAFIHNTVREIDPATGVDRRVKKLSPRCNFGVASGPVLVTDGMFVAGTSAMGCAAVDRRTLELAWHTEFGEALVSTTPYTGAGLKAGNISPIRLSGGLLCAPAADGAVHFFSAADGKEVSKAVCGVPYLSGAAEIPGGMVVAADFSGVVRAYTPPS